MSNSPFFFKPLIGNRRLEIRTFRGQFELGIRFYAGAPMISSDEFALGTLCVIDQKAKKLEPSQILALETVARQIVENLESRNLQFQLSLKNNELKEAQEKACALFS